MITAWFLVLVIFGKPQPVNLIPMGWDQCEDLRATLQDPRAVCVGRIIPNPYNKVSRHEPVSK